VTEKSSAEFSEDHRRHIGTTLSILDENLCSFERLTRGHAARGVLYEETNDLSPAVRRSIRKEISNLRDLLREMQGDLGLQPTRQTASHLIWIGCSMLWEHLVEIESRYLKAYGPVPAGLASPHDEKTRKVIERLQRISRLARSGRAGSPEDPVDE